jgi:choline-phosphate cytidylyltransferase
MMRSRQTNRDSRHNSDSSEEDNGDRSPRRGRSGNDKDAMDDEQEVDAQIEALMGENSKSSGA